MTTRKLTEIAMMAAVICVLAPLSIPLAGEVPISLATFAVMLAGTALGSKEGLICAALYLLLGAIGMPVFASYSSGVSVLFGVTGGFLIGYLPLAFFSGFIYEKFGRTLTGAKKYAVMVLAMLVGNVVLYALGIVWFLTVTKLTFAAAMAACVIPFIPGDILKIIVVCVIVPQLEPVIRKFSK